MSDWMTSNICNGIFCDILLEIPLHHVTSLLIGWHLVLHSSQHLSFCVNSTFFLTEKMSKCIRMGITAFKFVIWGGKSAVLQSLTRHRKTKFPTIKLPIYHPCPLDTFLFLLMEKLGSMAD